MGPNAARATGSEAEAPDHRGRPGATGPTTSPRPAGSSKPASDPSKSPTKPARPSTRPVKPPTTYAEWAACCDLLLAGQSDEEILTAMQTGHLEWTSGVAERITRRVHEVFDVRLKAVGDKFQRDVNHARGHETLLANALLDIRKGLIPVGRLAALPAWPDMVKQSLQQSLQHFVERSQTSLESSARSDRTGRMLDLLRRNRVCVPEIPSLLGEDAPPGSLGPPAASGVTQPRRIILT